MNKQYDPKIGWGPEPSPKTCEPGVAYPVGRGETIADASARLLKQSSLAYPPNERTPTFSRVYEGLGGVCSRVADLRRRARDMADRMTGAQPDGPLADFARHDSIPGAHMALVNELQNMLTTLEMDMQRIEYGFGLTEEF